VAYEGLVLSLDRGVERANALVPDPACDPDDGPVPPKAPVVA
jgi:hypothetical protein